MSVRPAPPVESALPVRSPISSATPGTWYADDDEDERHPGHRDAALRGQLREHEEEHDDDDGDPRAARPGDDHGDGRHERNRRAEDASIAVERLVEPKEERWRQGRREMLRVLVLERGRPRAPHVRNVWIPISGGRPPPRCCRPRGPAGRRRSMDHEVGDQDRDGEQLEQGRELPPRRSRVEGPADAHQCPGEVGPRCRRHRRELQVAEPRKRVGDGEQDAGEPADRPNPSMTTTSSIGIRAANRARGRMRPRSPTRVASPVAVTATRIGRTSIRDPIATTHNTPTTPHAAMSRAMLLPVKRYPEGPPHGPQHAAS